jgi:hypothetical protein
VEAQDETVERIANEEQTMSNTTPAPHQAGPAAATAPGTPEDGYAVWYFVGATFVFAGSGTALANDQLFFGVIGFIAGAVIAAAGAWAWRRAYVARRAEGAATGAPAALVSGAPASGVPASGASASGFPASGASASGVPASGAPASGAPASGASASHPASAPPRI